MQLETICLDAGGVLVWPNWGRISDVLRAHDVRVAPAALAAADPFARRALDDADLIAASSDHKRGWTYFDLILTHAGVTRSNATIVALAALEEYHRTANLWEIVPEFVRPALVELRTDGYTLVVVSNSNGTLREALDRLDVAPFVDAVVDSSEEGVEKPNPRLFERALERVHARPETTLHVGDFYHIDVVGARAAGLTPVLVDQANLYGAVDCARIPSIAALPSLVRQLRG